MPVLESSDNKIVPRSILRHRPIEANDTPSKDRAAIAARSAPAVPRASRVRPASSALAEEAIDELQRVPKTDDVAEKHSTSSLAPKPLKKLPRSTAPSRKKQTASRRYNIHPLFYLGLGMLVMLLLWMAVMAAAGWFSNTLNTIRYGYPRTYQTDQFVGHDETSGIPSHFIAINLHGHLEVIELPGGDAAHARIFEGPQLYTANADLVPVTLKFEDVNGDHKPDMLLCFQGSQIVFLNINGSFQPLTAAQRPQVEQFLQHPGASC
jgi:hypothetical protein